MFEKIMDYFVESIEELVKLNSKYTGINYWMH